MVSTASVHFARKLAPQYTHSHSSKIVPASSNPETSHEAMTKIPRYLAYLTKHIQILRYKLQDNPVAVLKLPQARMVHTPVFARGCEVYYYRH